MHLSIKVGQGVPGAVGFWAGRSGLWVLELGENLDLATRSQVWGRSVPGGLLMNFFGICEGVGLPRPKMNRNAKVGPSTPVAGFTMENPVSV